MGDKSNKNKNEDDSVTVMGLPGHPEKVGKSMSRRGEDIAREAEEDSEDDGSVDLGEKGSSGRPSGGSTQKSMTGLDPQDPVTQGDKKLRKA